MSEKPYSGIRLALKYLRYFLQSGNGKGHGIHSPFLYTFIREVLDARTEMTFGRQIESFRNRFLHDSSQVNIIDHGAGISGVKKVSEIARKSLKPPKYARLISRMVNYYDCRNILELGTSLGITTAYLATAGNNNKVYTIEGSPETAAIASSLFHDLNLPNIDLTTGTFEESLETVLKKAGSIDLAFLDGNHRKEPTLGYYQKIRPQMSSHGIIILDDIHWSGGMEEAWNTVISENTNMISVDLFFFGIIFFHPMFKVRQHFIIRF